MALKFLACYVRDIVIILGHPSGETKHMQTLFAILPCVIGGDFIDMLGASERTEQIRLTRMSRLRVAAFQLRLIPDETRAVRVERVLDKLDRSPSADLLVLPELWDVGYFEFDRYEWAARPLDDGPLEEVGALARKRGITIVAGSVLERRENLLHNTIAVCEPDGVASVYRKKHLFGYSSLERDLLTAGDEVVVCKSSLGAIGLATCFDLRFAGQFAQMRVLGADMFVVPSAWPEARRMHWDVLTRARAIETQTPLIACNACGENGGVELAGHSLIISATGEVLASASTEEAWLEATLDLDATDKWRREFPITVEF